MPPSRARIAIPHAGVVLDYVRRHGARRTVQRGAYVLANQVATVSIFDCIRLGPANVNTALLESFGDRERRFLDTADAARLASDLGADDARFFQAAMARGDRCYVVFDEGRIANLGLYTNRPAPIGGDLLVRFDSGHWYMYAGFTPAAFRGRRLHAAGILGAARELFRQGIPLVVSLYERTNYASMVSSLRMGFQQSGALYRVRLGSWARLGRTREAAALGMSLSQRVPGSLT